MILMTKTRILGWRTLALFYFILKVSGRKEVGVYFLPFTNKETSTIEDLGDLHKFMHLSSGRA